MKTSMTEEKKRAFDGGYKISENILGHLTPDTDWFKEFKLLILHYYMEVSSRILKEYYKCAYPHLMDRITPVKVVKHIKHTDLWMTDMYAFYRFFMRPKDTNQGITPVQENIILHGGDAHVENLISMIENIFNKPGEFGVVQMNIKQNLDFL